MTIVSMKSYLSSRRVWYNALDTIIWLSCLGQLGCIIYMAVVAFNDR